MAGIAEYATSLGVLAVLFCVFLALEFAVPNRRDQRPDGLRLVQAIVLYASGALLSRLILPLGLVSAALMAEARGIGLLNMLDVQIAMALIPGLLALDFTSYARHWIEHNVPLLWRLHRLHHSDTRIDLATAFRFHPFEAVFASLCHVAMVLMIGIPYEVVLLYIVIEAIFDLWEHTNAKTPNWLGRIKVLCVTPPAHRIHHEISEAHCTQNYGSVFSIWDRMFGTFADPDHRAPAESFGLHDTNIPPQSELVGMLIDPLKGKHQ